MKKLICLGLSTLSLAVASSVFAAQPTSITFDSKGKSADGQEYDNYTVKCSDGNVQYLTAWDGRKNWCVGKDSKEGCEGKQIKAAKAACK